MVKSKKKRKVTSTPLPTTTTIASLPDDIVGDILLRLPSAAAVCRAAFASAHWIRVASSPTFLRRLRDAHTHPLLLGHFVSLDYHGSTQPCFHPAPLRSESDSESEADAVLLAAAMVRRGDFFLTRILSQQGSGRHVLEDCRGGRLLFSDSTTLRVFDPMTQRVSSVAQLPRRRGGGDVDHRGRTLCLLPGPNGGDDPDDAFRVISMQHGNAKKQARFDVYDSCTRAWSVLPEAGTAKIPARSDMAKIDRGHYSPAMHAGDRIYWKYAYEDSLLSLDTKTMTFSDVRLPPGVCCYNSAYAVGETEDGTCCLVVGKISGEMQVWRSKLGDGGHEGDGAQMWELERQEPLELLGASASWIVVDQVRAIVGGIVLLCCVVSKTSPYQRHIAFRLKSLKVEAEFRSYGLARPFVFSNGMATCRLNQAAELAHM